MTGWQLVATIEAWGIIGLSWEFHNATEMSFLNYLMK